MTKNYLLIILLALCCFSCKDDDNNKSSGSMDPVTNASATSFVGSVILQWNNPSSSNLYYTLISYDDSEGKKCNKKVHKDDLYEGNTSAVIIGGFSDTNPHKFELTSYGYDGAHSEAVTLECAAQSTDAAKDYVIESVTYEAGTNSARIMWENPTGVPVTLVISYVDAKGVSQTVYVDASSDGKKIIGSLNETTEFTVYAFNTGLSEKSKVITFEVEPLIDPDDVIQPDINYITFGWGTNNFSSWSNSNPDNPYEYTFVTNGGDPFIYCNTLSAPIAGKTLVFRYKSTAAFTLELFWCDAGGGAAGGRSTTANVPANDTDEWATFTYDYTDAMSKHSWAGNSGDFIRFDLGNKADVTIQLRNVHFR